MFRRLFATVRGLLTRRRAERELDEELRFHVDMETQANIERGMPTVEARRTALLDVGGVDQTRERVRETRAWLFGERVQRDLRSGVRRIFREPALALSIIVTIGLVVGLASTIYALAASVLLRPLPYRDPEQLVQVWRWSSDYPRFSVSVPEYIEWKERCRSFQALGAARRWQLTLVTDGRAEWTEGYAVTPSLLPMLGASPVVGRLFRPSEDQVGRNKVVLLDEGFWRRAFGGDPKVIGTRVRLTGGGVRFQGPDTYEVVGVVPSSVRLRYRNPARCDFYVPLPVMAAEMQDSARAAAALWVFGRLRSRVSAVQAEAELQAIFSTASASFIRMVPDATVRVLPLHDELLGHTRSAFLLLSAAALLLVLIGCANVVNLLLTSGVYRVPEMSVRLALGCGRVRLAQQLFTETLVLSALGAALGVAIGLAATPVWGRLSPADLPRIDALRFNLDTVLFSVGLTGFCALFFGLGPSLVLSRRSVLGDPARRSRGGAGWLRFRGGLIVTAETALVVILLAGAGLVANSLWRMLNNPLGFNPHRVLVMQLMMPQPYGEPGRVLAYQRELLSRLRQNPRIIRVSISTALPFSEDTLSNYTLDDQRERYALVSAADPDLLPLLGVPLVEGRLLTVQDEGNKKVAVINQALATQIVAGGHAVGRRLYYGEEWREIVGVVGDATEIGVIRNGFIREKGLARSTVPNLYLPADAESRVRYYLLARTIDDERDAVPIITAEMRRVDPTVPFNDITTFDELVGRTRADTAFYAVVLGLFAVVALVLAGVGLFGVVAHHVARRSHEIGVRIALGATPGRVQKAVMSPALALVGVGAALGTSTAVIGGASVRAFLFDVSPSDPWTFAVTLGVLAVTAGMAAYLPARRAARIDPMAALRCE